MQRVSIWGRDVELQGSPLTLLVYRQEFDGDLSEVVSQLFDDEQVFIEPLLRIVWAMAKTADKNTSRYEDWLVEFPDDGFDLLNPPLEVILSAMNAELFRAQTPNIFQRIKQRIARFLERLAKRLGA